MKNCRYNRVRLARIAHILRIESLGIGNRQNCEEHSRSISWTPFCSSHGEYREVIPFTVQQCLEYILPRVLSVKQSTGLHIFRLYVWLSHAIVYCCTPAEREVSTRKPQIETMCLVEGRRSWQYICRENIVFPCSKMALAPETIHCDNLQK